MMYICLLLSLLHSVEKLLVKATNSNQIILILENFQENKNKAFFEYVPTINPLNPTKIKRFSSAFGERFHPIDKVKKRHYGLDISAPKDVPVHVSAGGKVTFTGYSSGYGKYIIVSHKYGFTTKYAHLNEILTKENAIVSKGDIIGRVGSTGKSTGAHLHYEVIKNNKHIDPYPLVNIK